MRQDTRSPRSRAAATRYAWRQDRRFVRRRLTTLVLVLGLAVMAVGGVLHAAPRLNPFHSARGAHGRLAGTNGSQSSHPIGPRRLKVTTHPEGASLTVHAANGSTRMANTPFTGSVPGGTVTLTLSLSGYNPLTQQVSLERNRSIDLWLDPAGLLHHELVAFSTCPAPKQVAFTPDDTQIWVTCLGGDGVWVYDAATRRRLHDIKLGRHGAVEVIFTKDGSTAYASQMETASVFEIDAHTYQTRRQMFTKGTWSKVMALSPDEKTLFVSNWVSDDVSEIDLTTGQVRRVIPTVHTPRGLYVTPDGARLFVAGFGNGELERINLGDLSSVVLIKTGGAMRHLVGDAAGRFLYADDMAGDTVYAVNLATEEVRKLAATDHMPNTIDLTPDGKVLYVSNRGANNPVSYYRPGPEWGSVLAIDTATGKVLDAIVGGNQTTGLDVSADGKTLAFSDFLDNRISLFDVPGYPALAAGGGGRATSHLADL